MATKKELEERIRENERQIKDLWEDIGILSNQIGQMKKTSKESDYLQVGDQWRDEEGNEYVLSNIVDRGLNLIMLISKDSGRCFGRAQSKSSDDIVPNNTTTRNLLNITDSMVKIK